MTDPLRRANRLAVDGARGEAAMIIAEVLRDDLRGDAISSLGFLVSDGLEADVLQRCWNNLGGWRALSMYEAAIETERFPHLALLVEIALKIDRERARRFVEDVYIPHMQREEILRAVPDRTIFFWHIPKCGGTALNTCLAQGLYRSGLGKLPSYTSRGFLNLLLREYTAEFPYLVSAHVVADQLDLPPPGRLYQVLSVRDPIDRAVSAWRQYYASMEKGRTVLPQHGAVWNYWPQATLAEWAGRAPPEVVSRQAATFSSRRNVKEAISAIRELDLVFDVSGMNEAVQRMAEEFDLSFDTDLLRTTRNVTDKSIHYELEEIEILRRSLAPDLALFHRLWWPRWLDRSPIVLSSAVRRIYPKRATRSAEHAFVAVHPAGQRRHR